MIGVGIALAIALAMRLTTMRWMPEPETWSQYTCSSAGVVLYYHPGGQRIRIAGSTAALEGMVGSDNRITWNQEAANAALGFVPPNRVLAGNYQTVRLGGGTLANFTCSAK
jgi:hypothetical protein